MTPALVALRCRTSEWNGRYSQGVEPLAEMLGTGLDAEARHIGSAPSVSEDRQWQEDLADARGCLLEAGGQVEDALAGKRTPVLAAAMCDVALTTLSAVMRHRPDARVLWLDAHGDFNTPETSASGRLGGMPLAGACGLWDAGLGADPVPAGSVVLAGVRSLDPGERELLEDSEVTVVGASPVETLVAVKNALDGAPVYVHLDPDVLEPASFPQEFGEAGGLAPEKLYDLFEAVSSDCEVVGLEVTSFFAPEDPLERQAALSVLGHVTEPLLGAISKEAHVSN